MSKEIRAFLAKAKQMLIGDGYYEKCQNLTDGSCPVCVIDQALNLLKQQLTAKELTKKIKNLAECALYDLIPDDKKLLLEACDRLDRAEADKKELLKLLKKALKIKDSISPDYSEHTIKLACDEMMVFIEDALAMLGYRSPVEDKAENNRNR